MPRTTRAAAKAEESILPDPDVDLHASKDNEALHPNEADLSRPPLRSISPTSVGSVDNERLLETVKDMAPKKGQAKKRNGRKKKAKDVNETAIQQPGLFDGVIEQAGTVVAFDGQTVQAASRQYSETDTCISDIAEGCGAGEISDSKETPAPEETGAPLLVETEAPQSAHALFERSTRSSSGKQAKNEGEDATESQREISSTRGTTNAPNLDFDPKKPEMKFNGTHRIDKAPAEDVLLDEPVQDGAKEAQDLPASTQHGVQEARNGIHHVEAASKDAQDGAQGAQDGTVQQTEGDTKDAQDVLEQVKNRTEQAHKQHELAPIGQSSTLILIEDPIDAIDALEDQLEEIQKNIPEVVSIDSPVKPERPMPRDPRPEPQNAKKTVRATNLLGGVPPRQSMANKLVKSTQPSATSQIKALAEPRKSVSNLTRSQSTKIRPTPRAGPKPEASEMVQTKGKPEDYLASKRRPVSLSFPTPPPPPKSKKAPTVSTFTLPGEAIAAKLKAERLEREKRKQEEEATRKRELKARPVPSTMSRQVEVRQTAASRARLSMMAGGGKENGTVNKRASVIGPVTKRDTSAASKRSSMVGAPSANAAVKRNSIVSAKPRPSSILVLPKQRPSIASASSSQPASRTTSTSTQKGREVFNRGRIDEEARIQAQREKDEAVKRARAEAAERGRKASREWAEKQKREKEKKARVVRGADQRPDASVVEMEVPVGGSEETASGAVAVDEV